MGKGENMKAWTGLQTRKTMTWKDLIARNVHVQELFWVLYVVIEMSCAFKEILIKDIPLTS